MDSMHNTAFSYTEQGLTNGNYNRDSYYENNNNGMVNEYGLYNNSYHNVNLASPATHLGGDFCPPSSPREEGGMFLETDAVGGNKRLHLTYQDKGENDIIQTKQTMMPANSAKYKLCRFHEKLFLESDGNVVFYVMESNAIGNLKIGQHSQNS